MKILVAGLGNPILGNDGVGWRVGQETERLFAELPRSEDASQKVEFQYLSLGGLSLMEQLIGFDAAILIDAFAARSSPPGTIYCYPLEEISEVSSGHLSGAHDTSLFKALQLGKSLGAKIPDKIQIVGIETETGLYFTEELSPEIAAVVPEASRVVLEQIHSFLRWEGKP